MKIIEYKFEESIDHTLGLATFGGLGNNGWILSSVISIPSGKHSVKYQYIFYREVEVYEESEEVTKVVEPSSNKKYTKEDFDNQVTKLREKYGKYLCDPYCSLLSDVHGSYY